MIFFDRENDSYVIGSLLTYTTLIYYRVLNSCQNIFNYDTKDKNKPLLLVSLNSIFPQDKESHFFYIRPLEMLMMQIKQREKNLTFLGIEKTLFQRNFSMVIFSFSKTDCFYIV